MRLFTGKILLLILFWATFGIAFINEQVEREILRNELLVAQNYDHMQGRMALADLYCKINDFKHAQAHLEYVCKNGIPESVEQAFLCSNLWLAAGCPQKTIVILEHLLTKYPHNPSIMHNLAYAYKIIGDVDKAIDILKTIVKLYPDHDDDQFALGHAYLAAGYFESGWKQHDKFLIRTNRYTPALKDWISTGCLLGKCVAIRQEGGLGDMIQWISCARRLKEMGATIIVCAPPALIPLLSRCAYLDYVINVHQRF